MLPPLAAAVASAAPRAGLAFHPWETGYYSLLSDEGVDLVATIADMVPDNLHGRAMGADRPVCAMRATHPLARQPLTLADYARWPHARITGGSDKDGFVEQALARQGLRREVRLSVPYFWSALRIVSDNDLLLTIPEHIAVKLAARASIVWQPLPFEAPIFRYWLLWHARNHHDPAHTWFRHQVFDVLQRFEHGVTRFNAD